MRARVRVVVVAFVAIAIALVTTLAFGYAPPPINGHVTDTAGKLSEDQRALLNRKLEDDRALNGNEIAVLVVPSLDGETIEDVAFTTFNAWKLGVKGADNGVLLVIAPGDRKVRIETGKGADGALTDLQANDIIRRTIGPLLKQDKFYEAIDAGTTAIDAALRKGGVESAPAPSESTSSGGSATSVLIVLAGLAIFVIAALLRGRFGGGMGGGGGGFGGGGGGFGGGGFGGGDSGGGDSGGGDSGGGGDFSGGGGESGGGGSSDSY